MAKFFVTNNIDWYQQTKQRISESDYSLAFDYSKDGVYALTTHKLKIDNVNACVDSNGNFAIATGTAIYKESLDYSNIATDFVHEGVEHGGVKYIRNNTVGQYAYTIKIKDKICIFGDAVGAYNIYYFQKEGYYYITNFLYDMAVVLRSYISINEMNVLEHTVQCCVLCGETIFNEIRRLEGDEFIVLEDNNFSIQYIPEMWKIEERKNEMEASEILVEKLKEKTAIAHKVLGDPTICMTGGLDSRMSLATYLSIGAKPKLFFGESNTEIAVPLPEDKAIVEEFAQKYCLPKRVMSWDTSHPDKNWDKYINRYGFLYRLWGAADDIISAFEDEKFCTCGYGGELFRSLPLTENRKADITMDELMTEYYMRAGHISLENEQQLYKHIESKLTKIAEKYELDINHLRPEDIAYFYIECRSVSDTITLNFLNCIGYSNLLLMESDIIKCARIPNEWMNKAKFMLLTMYKLYPSILDVPCFSRCHLMYFNKKKMMMAHNKDALRPNWLLWLKQVYQKAAIILKPFRNLYIILENREKYKISNTQEIQRNDIKIGKYERSIITTRIDFKGNANLWIEYMMNMYALTCLLSKNNDPLITKSSAHK